MRHVTVRVVTEVNIQKYQQTFTPAIMYNEHFFVKELISVLLFLLFLIVPSCLQLRSFQNELVCFVFIMNTCNSFRKCITKRNRTVGDVWLYRRSCLIEGGGKRPVYL